MRHHSRDQDRHSGFQVPAEKDWLDTWGRKDAHLHPTGTGPFKLAKWEPNQIIVLEKNPDYFKKGLPYLDRIELKIMKEGVTRAAALRAGEVDFVNYVPKEMVERLSKDAKLRVLQGPDTQNVNISLCPVFSLSYGWSMLPWIG